MDLDQEIATLDISDLNNTTPESFDKSHDHDLQNVNVNENKAELSSARRSLRPRMHNKPTENRRVSTRPKKLDSDVTGYYLDKRIKRLPQALETIFEEPKILDDPKCFMSSRKFKRTIIFPDCSTQNNAKVRKRRLKAKSITGRKRFKQIPIETVMKKIAETDDFGGIDNRHSAASGVAVNSEPLGTYTGSVAIFISSLGN